MREPSSHPRVATAIRIGVALLIAVGLARLVLPLAPNALDVRTDIVGYPTFANFDVNRLLRDYGLVVVFVPVVAIVAYFALTRVLVGPLGPWGPIPRPIGRFEGIPALTGRRESAVAVGRTLFVGLVLGLELAIAMRASAALALAATLTYGGGVALVASIAAARGHDRLTATRVVNTLAAPVSIAALYGVSRGTRVTVASTGAVHEYRWLPAWLAFGAAAVLLGFLARRAARLESRAESNDLERAVLLLVVAPVCVFLLTATLPGALDELDSFEEGQILAAASLVQEGFFPWRDLIVAHGVLSDVFRGLVGFHVFEDSRWGFVAGEQVLLQPLAWVGVYYLCAYLFWTNWLYLFVTQLFVVAGALVAIEVRFLLIPFVLLLLAALLAKPTAARAAAFTSLLAVQVIVTPEALAAAVAYLGTLVLFELYYYERGSVLALGFRRVWLCAATALVLAVAWAAFLAANHALDDWIFSFTALIPGHALTGGIPMSVPRREFEVVAPVAAVLCALALFVVWTRLRRPLSYGDWVMLAMAGFAFLYYPKFLIRGDGPHLQQAYSVAVPLVFYVVYRVLRLGERALALAARARGVSWFPLRHTITVALLLVFLVGAQSPLGGARGAPGHFASIVPREPVVERVGYDTPGANNAVALRAVSSAIQSLRTPGATVFDFTNAPGLFHYVYDLPPASRYYHVSLAIRQRTQSDLVKRLEEHPPGVVVLGNDRFALNLPSWDGISNQVRHYDVSSYLLDRYVPVLESHGFVLMVRRGPGVKADRHLYFSAPECDWGYVPNFFAPSPSPTARATQLAVRRGGNGKRYSVTLPADASSYDWLELKTEGPLPASRFTLSDRAGASTGHAIAFRSLARGENVIRVKVGACSQWHGYRPGVVRLTSSVPLDAVQVRVVR